MFIEKPIRAWIVVAFIAALGSTMYFLTEYDPDPRVQNVYHPGGVAETDQLDQRKAL